MNKRHSGVFIAMSALGLLSAGASLAANANQYGSNVQYDNAQVISSTPVYDRVSVPRRECYNEQVTAYDERSRDRVVYDDQYRYGDNYRDYNRSGGGGIGPGTILGAVLGGAIGHQFGNSSGGRDRGTAAGAIIGGLIGNNAENNGYRRASSPREYAEFERVPYTRDVQRCQTVADYRDEIRGYDVRYLYQGREYNTRMNYDPGSTLQVEVGVRPTYRQPTPTYSRSY